MSVCQPTGPLNAKIIVLGEAPGKTEDEQGIPFVGESGKLLWSMLEEVGIKRNDCRVLNVFNQRPPDNKLDAWCKSKKELPSEYSLPPLSLGKYLAPEYIPMLDICRSELERGIAAGAHVILALGATATWFLGLGAISTSRGVVALWHGCKVVPTYHPAGILRQWSLRAVAMQDLYKLAAEAKFPEVRRPKREIWIEPTLTELREFFDKYLWDARQISLDIENPGKLLHCIGLAPSPEIAICIPFVDPRKPDQSYWTYDEEVQVWQMLHKLLVKGTLSGKLRTIGQNLIYDVQHLAHHGLKLASIDDDTMLRHHAMYPELNKGLGFLGSIYTNELSWKQMAKDLGRDK